jgi:hypothetical protein
MMVSDGEIIDAGSAAWARLRDRERKTWEDWIAVARALAIGRAAAFKVAETNRAVGTRYNKAMGDWLRRNHLAEITGQDRYRALKVLDHLGEIEQWRESLDGAKRRKLNHPNPVWFGWRRSIRPPVEPQRAEVEQRIDAVRDAARRRGTRGIFWPQHVLRRCHQKVLDSRSTDLLVITRLILETAIADARDLYALLPPEPTPNDHRKEPA